MTIASRRPAGLTASTVAFLLATLVCGGTPDPRLAGPEPRIDVLVSECEGRVMLTRGQVLGIRLESNPTTGYSWKIARSGRGVLSRLGRPTYEAAANASEPRPLIGAGGWQTFRFRAAKVGEAKVELRYFRSWEKGVPPARVCRVEVTVEPPRK